MVSTDQQVRRLRQLDAQGTPRAVAAIRSGMDAKTARKYRRLGRLPSEVRMPHSWRTHPDCFADVWAGVAERLALNPGLEALTLFRQLQREHPGRFPDGQLRTLQRRVKTWRATHGPAKEVFFAQVHTPGRLCASDFTHMTDLRVAATSWAAAVGLYRATVGGPGPATSGAVAVAVSVVALTGLGPLPWGYLAGLAVWAVVAFGFAGLSPPRAAVLTGYLAVTTAAARLAVRVILGLA